VLGTGEHPTHRSRVGRCVRHGVGALAAVSVLVSGVVSGVLLGAAGAARASDMLTLNSTTAYVDPNLTAAFVTIPNLCLEPYGSQGTTTGCDELGVRAVAAIQGNSPYGDIYWEDGTTLSATNAFVPENPGDVSFGIYTGFAPEFSMHKYDLFGRGDEYMGPYTRAEMLLLLLDLNGGQGINAGTPPLTDPGESHVGPIAVGYARTIILEVLEEPENDTTIDIGALSFDLADLPTFERILGINTGGKRTTIYNYCVTFAGGPGPVADLLCGIDENTPGTFSFSTKADIWISLSGTFTTEQIVAYSPPTFCGASDGTKDLDNCDLREEWIDQTVVGYVEAWTKLGGDDHFAQNFRSQLNFDHEVVLNESTGTIVDQRIEQSTELSGAFTTRLSDPGDLITPGDNMDGIAGRETFQQAVQAYGGQAFGGDPGGVGQMMSQDVMGFIMECLNCTGGGGVHQFSPPYLDLEYQPYQTGWDVVPTIVHGGT